MLASEHRRRFLTRLGYGGLGLGATIFSATAYGSRIETDWLQLKRVSIPIAGLPTGLDGLVIVLMSDFHLYPHTRIELIRQAVAMANDCQPDLVVLGGDYVLRTADSIFALAPALAQLNPRFGIFAILGNHDHWKGVDTVEEGLIRSGSLSSGTVASPSPWTAARRSFWLEWTTAGWGKMIWPQLCRVGRRRPPPSS